MDVVTISNVKHNVVEFDIDIQGVDTSDLNTHFIIETGVIEVGLSAVKQDTTNKWEVGVPPLPFIEKTAYPFRIDVVVDGYHFTPFRGTVNVVGSLDLYASTPVNTTISAPAPAVSHGDGTPSIEISTESKQSAAIVVPTSTAEQIAQSIIKESSTKATKNGTGKDKVIKQILESTKRAKTTNTEKNNHSLFKKGKVVTQ